MSAPGGAESRSWTVLEVLDWTSDRFGRAGLEAGRLEAQVLLAHALGTDRVALYTGFDKPLGPEELGRYRDLVRRRLAGEPVAYLTGEQEFWSRSLAVDPRVLVPRRDTETLVEVVLDAIGARDAEARIAEVGTGSGAVAIALAVELPRARLVATDASADALAVARENLARHRLEERVELRAGDLLEPLAGERFDAVAANLPYVPTAEIDRLGPEVRAEPRAALDGGPDGLGPIRRLAAGVDRNLTAGAACALEHGQDQGEAVRSLLAAAGLEDPETRKDLAGRDRVTMARRPSSQTQA